MNEIRERRSSSHPSSESELELVNRILKFSLMSPKYISSFIFMIVGSVYNVAATLNYGYESEVSYFENEVCAWHFHTLFLEFEESSVKEALNLRRKLRELIKAGRLAECSLNQIYLGRYGPFVNSQYEMCCNATSFNAAHSFMAQNHGSLSVLVHPLTQCDLLDHAERPSWMGEKVFLKLQCRCLAQELPKPRPCPVYPEYSDNLPKGMHEYHVPIPGTEDYWGLNPGFDIMRDPY